MGARLRGGTRCNCSPAPGRRAAAAPPAGPNRTNPRARAPAFSKSRRGPRRCARACPGRWCGRPSRPGRRRCSPAPARRGQRPCGAASPSRSRRGRSGPKSFRPFSRRGTYTAGPARPPGCAPPRNSRPAPAPWGAPANPPTPPAKTPRPRWGQRCGTPRPLPPCGRPGSGRRQSRRPRKSAANPWRRLLSYKQFLDTRRFSCYNRL